MSSSLSRMSAHKNKLIKEYNIVIIEKLRRIDKEEKESIKKFKERREQLFKNLEYMIHNDEPFSENKSESNTPVTSPASRGGSKNNKKSRTIKVLKKL